MAARVILITGANTGIGFESVKALIRSNAAYNVILGGRSIEKVTAAVSEVKEQFPVSASKVSGLQLDVTDDASIIAAYEQVSRDYGHIDVLVNNAGASFDRYITEGTLSTRQAWLNSWDTNVVGAHIMTETFAPLLLKSSEPRLIFLTSGAASIEETLDLDNPRNKSPAKGWPKSEISSASYRCAKVGLNMVMRDWTRVLREDGVKVFAVAPGLLATGLAGGIDMRKFGAGEPSIGGDVLRRVIEGERDADAGKIVRFYSDPIQPW